MQGQKAGLEVNLKLPAVLVAVCNISTTKAVCEQKNESESKNRIQNLWHFRDASQRENLNKRGERIFER